MMKSYLVLEYCLHEGSELVVAWARENINIIKLLEEHNCHWRKPPSQRRALFKISADALTSLIADKERLRGERADCGPWNSRVLVRYGS